MEIDWNLAVEYAMGDLECAVFLYKFIRHNPRWAGARVADVLSALADSDSDLDTVEPMYALYGADISEPGLLGAVVRVMLLIHPQGMKDEEKARMCIFGLTRRARDVAATRRGEVLAKRI